MQFAEPPQSPMDRAIEDVRLSRLRLDEAQRELASSQELLVHLLAEAGQKSASFGKTQATVVQTETLLFDESGLKKALGARVYNKLTTPKLDRKKLEAAVEVGDLDPIVVAQYATEKKGTPYIRMTEKK